MGRIKFYGRVIACWLRGGHDWKNIITIPPYRQCRVCGGFGSVKSLDGS